MTKTLTVQGLQTRPLRAGAPESQGSTNRNRSTAHALLIVNGIVHQLRREVVEIGRSLDNQVILDDPGISRRHAALRFVQGRYEVLDRGSTRGTALNGQPIRAAEPLTSGDVITLATISLIYVELTPARLQKFKKQTGPLDFELLGPDRNSEHVDGG